MKYKHLIALLFFFLASCSNKSEGSPSELYLESERLYEAQPGTVNIDAFTHVNYSLDHPTFNDDNYDTIDDIFFVDNKAYYHKAYDNTITSCDILLDGNNLLTINATIVADLNSNYIAMGSIDNLGVVVITTDTIVEIFDGTILTHINTEGITKLLKRNDVYYTCDVYNGIGLMAYSQLFTLEFALYDNPFINDNGDIISINSGLSMNDAGQCLLFDRIHSSYYIYDTITRARELVTVGISEAHEREREASRIILSKNESGNTIFKSTFAAAILKNDSVYAIIQSKNCSYLFLIDKDGNVKEASTIDIKYPVTVRNMRMFEYDNLQYIILITYNGRSYETLRLIKND